MKTFPIITTERLILRQVSDSDIKEIFMLRSDALINQYLDRQLCETLEDSIRFIEKIKSSTSYWAIAQNDKLVGTICLFDFAKDQKKCEIGFELLTQYQGKGFMREAAKKILEFANQTLKINTIVAYTHKDNLSSYKLLKELKFKPAEGLINTDHNLVLFRLNMDITIY